MSKEQNKPKVTKDPDLNSLSRREREVLARILSGGTSQGIADFLHISVKTIETHRTHINRKLGVNSAVGLVLLAVARGWLAADGEGNTELTFAYERSTWDGKFEKVAPGRRAA